MNIQPVTAEVASDDRLWHGMASCPCRAGSDRSQATVQVYVQGGGGPGPFTGSRPRVQTGSPPQPLMPHFQQTGAHAVVAQRGCAAWLHRGDRLDPARGNGL